MRWPVKNAVIKDFLAYKSARVSVSCTARLTLKRSEFLLFSLFPQKKRGGACLEIGQKGMMMMSIICSCRNKK
jgi:hypothetical protein